MKNALLFVVLGVTACSAPEAKVEKINALNRIWIDHLPKTESDMINIFAAITEEPMGVFQATSVWKGNFELFVYEAHGDTIRATYPQDRSREDLKVNARECSDVRDMDYCLEIKGASRGPKKYYSRKGWEIDATATPEDITLRGKMIVKQLASE